MKKIKTMLLLAVLTVMMMPASVVFAQEPIESVYLLPKDNVYAVSNPNRNYLTVVNGTHPISEEYLKELWPDLVYFPNAVDGDTMAVEKAAYLAFTRLQRDLEVNDGMRIALYDGFRTNADQMYLIENGLVTTVAAVPGYSEHHTGLLLDVVVWYNGEWTSETLECQQKIPYFRKLHEKMADYGFIDRYPAGKECITGIPAIPYEMRFVGSPVVAHAIMDNGLCLEEFLGMQ